MTKNVVYSSNLRYNSNNSSSITSDSNGRFIYLLLAGVNGGLFKIGTGLNSERGKVYLYKKFCENNETSYQWVFCKGKLYMKIGNAEFGYISVINTETFETEGRLKLVFPANAYHSGVKNKNTNYVLLSDRSHLKVIMIEPVLNLQTKMPFKVVEKPNDEDSEEEPDTRLYKTPKKIKKENLSDIFTHLNLLLLTYEIDQNSKSILDESKEALMKELLQTFSCLYNREECYKALSISNWNFEDSF